MNISDFKKLTETLLFLQQSNKNNELGRNYSILRFFIFMSMNLEVSEEISCVDFLAFEVFSNQSFKKLQTLKILILFYKLKKLLKLHVKINPKNNSPVISIFP
jgi:hypothetical protein